MECDLRVVYLFTFTYPRFRIKSPSLPRFSSYPFEIHWDNWDNWDKPPKAARHKALRVDALQQNTGTRLGQTGTKASGNK